MKHDATSAAGDPVPAHPPPLPPPITSSAPPPLETADPCGNCGVALRGAFCAACGQEAHRDPRALATLVNARPDRRGWKTVAALLVAPGQLTVAYLSNHRMRYLPPIRVYLVASLVFFALAMRGPGGRPLRIDPGAAETGHEAEPAEAAQEDGKDGTKGKKHPPRWTAGQCAEVKVEPGWLREAMVGACERAAEDGGREIGRTFLASIPRVMFVFLPLVALVTWALFGRAQRGYAAHLVFLLHLQAAAFAFFTIQLLLSRLGDRWAAANGFTGLANFLLGGYALYYGFRAARVVYAEGRFRTFLKLLVLGFSYVVLLALSLVGAVVYSAFAA